MDVNAISHRIRCANAAFSSIETVNGSSAIAFNINSTPTLNLNGGAGDDVFNFAANANLTGVIDGQSGSDQLLFTNYNASVTVTLNTVGTTDGFNGTTSGINGTFANIDSIIGSTSTTDTLNGANLSNNWKFEVGSWKLEVGSNSLTFSAIETLNGGTSDDTFTVANTASFNGAISGGAGNDTLGYAGNTTNRTVTLTALGATDGFNGTASGIANGFSNINALVGGNGSDALTSVNGGLWSVVSANSGTFTNTNTLAFSSVENLFGGKRRGYD